jgi:hypothetical protein
MPLKMMMMFKKYIITLQISNYILKKSVVVADFLILQLFILKHIQPDALF